MKMSLTVYYQDGSSGIVEFEKPPGAHPESVLAINACLRAARFTGKEPARICNTYGYAGMLMDRTVWEPGMKYLFGEAK